MIEKEYITSPEDMPDKTETLKKPIFLKIGFTFALLGLATPFLVYLAIYVIIPTPRPGEDHTPGDGLGMMVLAIFGIIWWTFTEFVSVIITIIGLARKETGRIKIFAVASSVLSLLLIVSVYIGTALFVKHVSDETKRYESSRNI